MAGDELAKINAAVSHYLREISPTRPETEIFYEDKTDPGTIKQM